MNKKLIAAAVAAGLAAPLAAQADVTAYGQLQVEIANVKTDGLPLQGLGSNDRTAVAAGESAIKMSDNKRGRLGFKASEDLGGGLKALAKFEWQVDTANANVNDGAREGWVGLKGGFGELQFGQTKAAYKYTGGVAYDPFITTFLEARDENGAMSGSKFGQNGFWNNNIAYIGNFGNVGVWVNYGVDEGDGTSGSGNNGDISAAVKYGSGNWEAFVAHSSQDSTDLAMNKVGGQVKFGASTLSAQYETGKDAADEDQTYAFLGYQLKMGANAFVAQLGHATIDNPLRQGDTDYYALGVIHKMSKQTRVFGGYRKTSADNPAFGDASAITVGMRVDF